MQLPSVVRRRAEAAGAGDWVRELPQLVAQLEHDWQIAVGRVYDGGTEAFVADADLADGTAGVLKILVPREDDVESREITALQLAGGRGCATLLRADADRGAMLLERLGPSMFDLGVPYDQRLPILADLAAQMWRPAPDAGLPTGAEKAIWLRDFIAALWEELDHPCDERTIDQAVRFADARALAHDDERAVLVHGDVHQWNALRADGGGYKLVDPDGLLADAEYDLAILMREDPLELLRDGPFERARMLAQRHGLDVDAIWEWGAVERVSTGLLCVKIGLEPVGREMLHAADVISGQDAAAT